MHSNPAKTFELWASSVVGEWVGADGEVIHTGTRSGLDFEIHYRDGRLGVGEVGTALDPTRQQQWARVLKEPTPQRHPLAGGSGNWTVSLQYGAHIGGFLDQVDDVIRLMRRSERVRLEVFDEWPRIGVDPIADAARRAGIRYLSLVDPMGADQCVYFLAGIGGVVPTDSNAVVEWLDDFLERPQNQDYVAKLATHRQAQERHLFLLVAEQAGFGICELLTRSDNLPSKMPVNAGIATHIWLTARFAGQDDPLTWLCTVQGWQVLHPTIQPT